MYQHLWRPENPTGECERDCGARYEWLKTNVLEAYQRPFSVLDVGGNAAYFGRRITHDFPHATVVTMERDPIIVESLKTWPHPMLAMHTEISAGMLSDMAGHEMFDLVLCMSFLHHIPLVDVPLACAAVLDLGFEVMIELPERSDTKACGGASIAAAHRALDTHITVRSWRKHARFACHTSTTPRPAWLFANAGKRLVRSHPAGVIYRDPGPQVTWRSHREPSAFRHPRHGERDWTPGIKLDTLLRNGGAVNYDLGADVARALRRPTSHGDITPWNVIVTHRDATLIDGFHHGDSKLEDDEGIAKILERTGKEIRRC